MPKCLENYYARMELVHISNELVQIKFYNAPTSQSPRVHFHYFYAFLSKNLHAFKIKSLTFYHIKFPPYYAYASSDVHVYPRLIVEFRTLDV